MLFIAHFGFCSVLLGCRFLLSLALSRIRFISFCGRCCCRMSVCVSFFGFSLRNEHIPFNFIQNESRAVISVILLYIFFVLFLSYQKYAYLCSVTQTHSRTQTQSPNISKIANDMYSGFRYRRERERSYKTKCIKQNERRK